MSINKIYPIILGVSLTAFTAYISLDTFAVPDVYKQVEENNSFVFKTPASSDTTPDPYDPKKSDKPVTSVLLPQTTILSEKSQSVIPVSNPASTQTAGESSQYKNTQNNQDNGNNIPSVTYADTQQTEPETVQPQYSDPVITENTYSDSNIQINITSYREYDTDIYVADITVSSLEYLRTALADNSYGKNVTAKTSKIAGDSNAIFAVNGDYYGARESGYVIRNGVLYRDETSDNRQDLVIWADGSFQIINENEITADMLLDMGAYQVLSFGPGLVSDSNITVSENEEVSQAMVSNPRTAIGILESNHFIFVVSDGRTSQSSGLSLYELAGFMKNLGAYTAYNLDGGGSSAMYFNGRIINNPTADGRKFKERSVSDIVYIGY